MNEELSEDRPPPPERVGPYRIEDCLGVGGMGEVYRAFDERLERWVAMKHILPGDSHDRRAWERLRREARAVASLNHPSIVRIHDIFETEAGDWIVMELIAGQTLHRLINDSAIAIDQAVGIAREVAEGLAAAHARGIVHRDLKTENVMVTPDGHAKILDFGLAKQSQQDQSDVSQSQNRWIQGTGRAMSPEQVNGQDVDHRSDLFSLGTLLFESLTGQSPFLDSKGFVQTLIRVCDHQQPSVRSINHEVSEEVASLVDYLLSKDPESRPQSTHEVVAALSRISGVPYVAPMDQPEARAVSLGPQGGSAESSSSGSRPKRIASGEIRTAQAARPQSSSTASRLRRESGASRLTGSKTGIFIKTLMLAELAERDQVEKALGRYTAFMFFARHDRMVRELLVAHGGQELSKREGFVVLFERPADAVRFAISYRERLLDLEDRAKVPLEGRVAIHLGEVYELERESGDPPGSRFEIEECADQLLRRAAGLADGRILLTQEARNLARQTLEQSDSEEEALAWEEHGVYLLGEGGTPVILAEVSTELIDPLERIKTSGTTRSREPRSRALRPLSRVAVFLGVAMLIAAAFLRWNGTDGLAPGEEGLAPAVMTPRESLAVIGFKNLSGKEASDWLATALVELVSTELAASGQLRVISGETVARMKAELKLPDVGELDEEQLAQVGKNLRTRYVVIGVYELGEKPPGAENGVRTAGDTGRQAGNGIEAGEILRLLTRVQDTRSGETVAEIRDERPASELFDLVTEAGQQMRAGLEVAPMPVETVERSRQVFRTALPSDDLARQLYSRGLARLRAYDALTARDLFEQAIAAEPEFALSHANLAEALLALGYDQKAQESARRASELAEKWAKTLPREAELTIRGRFYEALAEWDKAVSRYRALREFFPDNPDYGLRLADALTAAGRGEEALATLAELRQQDEELLDDPRLDLSEAAAMRLLADYDRIEAVLLRAVEGAQARSAWLLVAEAQRQLGWYYRRVGPIEKATENLEAARERFDRAGDRGRYADVVFQLGRILDYHGDMERAERLYRSALEIHQGTGNRRSMSMEFQALGFLAQDRGDLRAARQMFQNCLSMAQEIRDRRLEGFYRATISVVALQQGEIAEAEKQAQEVRRLSVELGNQELEAYSLYLQGTTAFLAGELSYAESLFMQVVELSEEMDYLATAYRGYLELVGVYLARAKFDDAWQAARKVQELAVELGAPIYDAVMSEVRALLEKGELEQAAEQLRGPIDDLGRRGLHDIQATALLLFTQILIEQGRHAEAAAQFAPVQEFAEKSCQRPVFRLNVKLTRARLLLHMGDHPGAMALLDEVEQSLAELWAKETELEMRWVRGQALVAMGETEKGQRILEALIQDAELDGYIRVADRARAALGS